jgi:hypothetical protein
VSSTPRRKLLALDAPRLDGRRDLLVADRVGVAEGQVFQLAAHLAHAQPVSQRRVNVLGLAGDGLLAVRLQVLQGAHVVQPVGQLDEHHAHVRDHGQQHLAHVFSLAVFAIGKLDLVDLGDALDDVGHLVAEAGGNLLVGGGRVLDRVVQQAGGDGRRVHLHLRQHLGHLERMDDVRLAGGPHLPFMMRTQNSQALRMREMSSLGRLAWTCLSSASKRWSMVPGRAGWLGARATQLRLPVGAGDALGTSAGMAAGQSPCFIIGRLRFRAA